ncbi:winged helix-turn-helix domain-containing tetratricopeptide repeat protein [Bradyrhizobium sp. 6(2017)]|uniref:winged helix-turn-helix domain-containing tetratricopeptide repeat protein n=1 Tax=Bradyrhizobium sp. 6(2017) TaxID=1197460 RepID=UPI0013E1DF12|nr:winged helix-turn-helix domain-containing protein [Bradyrhizobium sp. 6(2017)]QIG94904.1 adenylate cyclase [Bradyrhizobium sp. 6(2017)]
MRYLFEEYAFDTDLRELYRGAHVVSVAPQVFDLLDYLIRNRKRVVSKDDLINTVWNGRVVSDAALATRLNVARSAIGDSGVKQRLIKTLQRKGFRFVGTVQEVQRPADAVLTADSGGQIFRGSAGPGRSDAVPPDGHASGTRDGATRSIPAPRLSIVVLPFANLGGDPEQDYFADGVTDSLTTDLSRISDSFVFARNTAFTFKGKAVNVEKVGRELNVRYVLEGSVQRGGNRLRVNVQLIDVETGNHLWADRFEKPVVDLFDMQDEVVSRLANTLNAELIEVEARRAGLSIHPDAMDLYFQGWACANNGTTAEYMTQAQAFFDRALALDPGNIGALVGSARVNAAIGANLMRDDWIAHLTAAEVALTRALSLAPNHAQAHSVLGLVQSFTNPVQGIAECERALALDHNLADAHAFIGLAKFFLGRGEETEAHIREALRLSPRDTNAYRWFMFVGLAKLFLGADVEAVVWLRRSIEANRNHPVTHCYLAAALSLLGSPDKARAAAQAGLLLNPTFNLRRYRARAASDHPAYLAGRERVYEGMRMAGVPDE